MRGRAFSAVVVAAALVMSFVDMGWRPAAATDHCESPGAAGGAVDNGLFVGMSCGSDGGTGDGAGTVSTLNARSPFTSYVWVSICQRFDPTLPRTGPIDCSAARACVDPAERVWALWGQRPRGTWEPLGTECFGRPPTVADTPQPTVTPALVLTALRRLGLPAIKARTQPEGRTLVNFETIFYAEPEPFSRTITLLGQRVDIEAVPAQFTWQHGDGTSASTETPGAPYPDKDVIHEYTDAYETVQTRVDVTYRARFRVNSGAWQDIAETVTVTGPTSSLRISEATAVLSGQYD